MGNQFTKNEKKKYKFKKHIKNHLFEYIIDIVGPIILTVLLLFISKAQKYAPAIIISVVYGILKTVYNIYHYKKEYIDVDN